MNGKFFTQLPGHHHFSNIRTHIDQQANRENHDTLCSMYVSMQGRCIAQPENQHTGIQGINNKSGSKNPEHLSCAQVISMFPLRRFKTTFLKKKKYTPIAIRKPLPP